MEEGEVSRCETRLQQIDLAIQIEISGNDGTGSIRRTGTHGENSPGGPGATGANQEEEKDREQETARNPGQRPEGSKAVRRLPGQDEMLRNCWEFTDFETALILAVSPLRVKECPSRLDRC